MKYVVLSSPAFVRSAKRYLRKHPAADPAIDSLLIALAADPFSPSLRTHKLKGSLAGSWAASGGYDLRIVFQIVKHSEHLALHLQAVGTHDDVY